MPSFLDVRPAPVALRHNLPDAASGQSDGISCISCFVALRQANYKSAICCATIQWMVDVQHSSLADVNAIVKVFWKVVICFKVFQIFIPLSLNGLSISDIHQISINAILSTDKTYQSILMLADIKKSISDMQNGPLELLLSLL